MPILILRIGVFRHAKLFFDYGGLIREVCVLDVASRLLYFCSSILIDVGGSRVTGLLNHLIEILE